MRNTKLKVASLATRAAPKALSSTEIYERILTAISEHRLRPGMQLVEDKLAKIFDVSRTKIREATARLIHDGLATNIPNRGAFVSSPTAEQAQEVFAVRRLIEPELMRLVACNATPKQIATLRAHVKKEVTVRAGGDSYAMIPLSGEFHLLVAEMAGNSLLSRMLRELETLTCLIIILYDSPKAQSCPYDDHLHLVEAIEARDPERAAKLMLHHLDHIEGSLDLSPPVDKEIQLEDAFNR